MNQASDNPEPAVPESSTRWHRAQGSSGARRTGTKILLVLIVALLLAAGVVLVAGRPLAFAVITRLTSRKFPEVRWVEPGDLARWRADPGNPPPVVLDARTDREFVVSHLRDARRMDPYRPLLTPLKGFSKDTAIVVSSSVGYRSARLAHWLRQQGYTGVRNLAGGLFLWANQGRPLFQQGRPAVSVHPYDGRWGLLLEAAHRAEAPDIEKQSAAP